MYIFGYLRASTSEQDAERAKGILSDFVEQKGMRLEYVSVRRSEDLAPAAAGDWELIILMAVWLGKARLIDNVQVLLEAPLRGTAV